MSQQPVEADVLQPLSPQNLPVSTGRIRLSATIPEWVERRLREMAEAEEEPMSAIVRRALAKYIRERDKGKAS